MQKTVAVNEAGLRIGEDHPKARYTDHEIGQVLRLRDDGLGYKRIAKVMDMPKGTVRNICKGFCRCQTVMGHRRVPIPECE